MTHTIALIVYRALRTSGIALLCLFVSAISWCWLGSNQSDDRARPDILYLSEREGAGDFHRLMLIPQIAGVRAQSKFGVVSFCGDNGASNDHTAALR